MKRTARALAGFAGSAVVVATTQASAPPAQAVDSRTACGGSSVDLTPTYNFLIPIGQTSYWTEERKDDARTGVHRWDAIRRRDGTAPASSTEVVDGQHVLRWELDTPSPGETVKYGYVDGQCNDIIFNTYFITAAPTLLTRKGLRDLAGHEMGHLYGLYHDGILDNPRWPYGGAQGLTPEMATCTDANSHYDILTGDDSAYFLKLHQGTTNPPYLTASPGFEHYGYPEDGWIPYGLGFLTTGISYTKYQGNYSGLMEPHEQPPTGQTPFYATTVVRETGIDGGTVFGTGRFKKADGASAGAVYMDLVVQTIQYNTVPGSEDCAEDQYSIDKDLNDPEESGNWVVVKSVKMTTLTNNSWTLGTTGTYALDSQYEGYDIGITIYDGLSANGSPSALFIDDAGVRGSV